MKTSEDHVMAVADTVDPDGWMVTFNDLMGRIASRFGRIEPRRTATAYVRGLLSDLERKNCWNLAEHAGQAGPQAMQRLLRTACWDADADADAVRDDVRGYVIEQLGPGGVLIVDETGFVKKGVGLLSAISYWDRPAYQWTSISVMSITSNVLLAITSPRLPTRSDDHLQVMARSTLTRTSSPRGIT